MKKIVAAMISFLTLGCAAAPEGPVADLIGCRWDFDSERDLAEKWHLQGFVLAPRQTKFRIVDADGALDNRALAVSANCSSGFLIVRIDKLVDLARHPYMRWRWRIVRRLNLPEASDDPDDQACVIYFVEEAQGVHRCVGYRWEHNTPVGAERTINYGYGARRVRAHCLRNRDTAVGEWVEEERNVLEDFRAAFGTAPTGKIGITVGGNSQYSKSDTWVEIDYIEFRAFPTPAPTPAE